MLEIGLPEWLQLRKQRSFASNVDKGQIAAKIRPSLAFSNVEIKRDYLPHISEFFRKE